MSQNPQTTNNAAVTVSGILGDAVNAAVSVAEASIIADVPFLGLPIVKQVFEALLNYIAGKFGQALEQAGISAVIDTQVNGELSAFSQTLNALKQAQATGDQNAITEARKAADAAAASLIHYDGSA